MSATIPESYRDLFEKPVYVTATTIMPDGQPQSTIVWADYDGQFVRINVTTERQKYKNLSQNPRITLVALDPQDPFRWIEVRGIVESMSEQDGVAHIEKLSRKYTGQKYYGGFNTRTTPEQETRVLINIRPIKVNTFPG